MQTVNKRIHPVTCSKFLHKKSQKKIIYSDFTKFAEDFNKI